MKISNQRKKREERKFLTKEWEKAKKKRKKIPNQRMGERMGESKERKEESSWSKEPEEMCREVFRPDSI